MSARRMLLAIRDGVVDVEGRAEEICAGMTRIAPEILRERPELGEFFEPDFSVAAVSESRAEVRVLTPDGRTVADPRF